MTKNTQVQVPISQRALIQRINRALKVGLGGQVLKTLRGERWRSTLGQHYVVDVDQNRVVRTDVDLEEYAREIEVLRAWECLEKEDSSA